LSWVSLSKGTEAVNLTRLPLNIDKMSWLKKAESMRDSSKAPGNCAFASDKQLSMNCPVCATVQNSG
jgi:hypothetical protein